MTAISKKDVRWLRACAARGGIYPGARVIDVPVRSVIRLQSAGLIEWYAPSNPIHHERYRTTPAGDAYLAQQGQA